MENTSTIELAPLETTSLGRKLAVAQQIKDTLTILGMNILLIFGIMFGVAIPGLVLYFLRWRLTRGKSSRTGALLLWGIGVLHEVLCAFLFASADLQSELHDWATYLAWGYILGVIINLFGLAETLTNQATPTDSALQ
ncbi:hypothetical protein [Hymenobacter cavernae]|uniref:DUF805 domain-containing protein n=1 Tax=Hymenobacter cavernae TaxID=2044852 RepID=A0ABQ1THJ2_9BACT|nr:hypothetical protein [Hymenobacter cavernae]GGE95565.1 hypothetical protein GCM10011383_02870 [Hymenobacter cavernae]